MFTVSLMAADRLPVLFTLSTSSSNGGKRSLPFFLNALLL